MYLKSKKIIDTLFHCGIILIILSSIYFGFQYSYYNQDYHHSFFILSMIIDYQNNLKLFEEVFLQYGPGQTIFFSIFKYLIDINIVTINQITVIFFSFNLLILYLIFRKISSTAFAFLLILTIFLIHPFSIYPWPDYLSGTCLTLFYFFLLKKDKANIFACSFFLFLAVFFRSTYLINILSALIFFSLFCYFLKQENFIKKIFILFLVFLTFYFSILYYFDNLGLWFSQSIGLIGGYASGTKNIQLHQLVTSYVGEYGFIILKIIFYGLRSFINLFDLTNLYNIIFLVFISLNFFYLLKFFKNKHVIVINEKKIIFISILGLFGFVQSYMLMELFRNINSTIGIFISSAFILRNNQEIKNFFNKYIKILLPTLFIFYSALLFKFPVQNYESENYQTLKNSYFSDKKKMLPEVKIYYEKLSKIICDDKQISLINTSKDFGISYLCEKNNIKNKISNHPFFIKRINPEEYDRIINKRNLKQNEILVSEGNYSDQKLLLIEKFESPHTPKEWFKDIYIYKKK